MSSDLMEYFSCVYDDKLKIWKSATEKNKFNNNESMGQVLFERLNQRPQHKLQVDDTYNVTITNAQAVSWAISIAEYLKELGLDHKDIVGISARNSTYLLPVVLGCFFNCTPFHAVNPDLDEDTVSHCYGLTKPKLIFCDGEIYEKIRSTTKNYCSMIVTISEHIEGVSKVLDLLRPTMGEENYQPQKLVEGPSQTIAILCSSGTTGKPKAVCISTPSLISENPFLTSDLVVFIASGIDWYTGLWFLINNCLSNFTRIISKRLFDPGYFLELVRKYQLSYAFLSSRYVAMMVNHPLATKENLSSLQAIQFGGSNLSEATLKRFMTLFNENVIVSFGYGITEIGAIAFNLDKTRTKSVGKLLPNLQLRIINENGDNLSINEVGEVLINNPITWKGYYGNPEETARALDSQGWFHTGDLGYMDEQHYLYLVDRKKEILKYQGLHYWPNEIEHVVAEIPDVMDVCVVSVFDEQLGDAAAALIVKTENSLLTEDQVIEYVKKRLVLPHKQINAGVYFVAQLPYNSNNKCLRNKAKIMLQSLMVNKNQ
ncbi:probable 4-coumarate--CoA ligase 1 [Calliphora vicina]|uniref:probable 4-coumarate--CoA ligase 1 n=1 Tax=Calliphora vicina TaxID=7373 RepID=UPI00325BCF2F